MLTQQWDMRLTQEGMPRKQPGRTLRSMEKSRKPIDD